MTTTVTKHSLKYWLFDLLVVLTTGYAISFYYFGLEWSLDRLALRSWRGRVEGEGESASTEPATSSSSTALIFASTSPSPSSSLSSFSAEYHVGDYVEIHDVSIYKSYAFPAKIEAIHHHYHANKNNYVVTYDVHPGISIGRDLLERVDASLVIGPLTPHEINSRVACSFPQLFRDSEAITTKKNNNIGTAAANENNPSQLHRSLIVPCSITSGLTSRNSGNGGWYSVSYVGNDGEVVDSMHSASKILRIVDESENPKTGHQTDNSDDHEIIQNEEASSTSPSSSLESTTCSSENSENEENDNISKTGDKEECSNDKNDDKKDPSPSSTTGFQPGTLVELYNPYSSTPTSIATPVVITSIVASSETDNANINNYNNYNDPTSNSYYNRTNKKVSKSINADHKIKNNEETTTYYNLINQLTNHPIHKISSQFLRLYTPYPNGTLAQCNIGDDVIMSNDLHSPQTQKKSKLRLRSCKVLSHHYVSNNIEKFEGGNNNEGKNSNHERAHYRVSMVVDDKDDDKKRSNANNSKVVVVTLPYSRLQRIITNP